MPSTMAKKKQPYRHKNVLLPLRVPPAMKEVLQQYADKERRSLAQASALLMEEILVQKGLWPQAKEGGQG